MPRNDLSIIVVDDMKFSCAFVTQVLSAQGCRDIREATSADEALAMLAERPADVLLADWVMPGMDGLELTDQVRRLDKENGRYTCVILLTAREGVEPLIEAFDRGVDDYLTKPPNRMELAARIRAAARVAGLQNDLLDSIRNLTTDLERHTTLDRLTGLGNRREMETRLDQYLRVVSSRGGATCAAVIQAQNLDWVATQHGDVARDETLTAIGRRLRGCVRPIDVVARIDDEEFGVVHYYVERDQFRPRNFRRLLQALNLRPFRTSVGFLTIRCAIGLCCVRDTDAPASAKEMIDRARSKVDESRSTGYQEVAI